MSCWKNTKGWVSVIDRDEDLRSLVAQRHTPNCPELSMRIWNQGLEQKFLRKSMLGVIDLVLGSGHMGPKLLTIVL